MTAIVIFSFLFAFNRGLVWNWMRSQRNRRTLRARAVLADLNTLAEQHPNQEHGHSVAVLRTMSPNPEGVSHALKQLKDRGHAVEVSPDSWALTQAGLDEAERRQKEGS
jgi:hypothetical protein